MMAANLHSDFGSLEREGQNTLEKVSDRDIHLSSVEFGHLSESPTGDVVDISFVESGTFRLCGHASFRSQGKDGWLGYIACVSLGLYFISLRKDRTKCCVYDLAKKCFMSIDTEYDGWMGLKLVVYQQNSLWGSFSCGLLCRKQLSLRMDKGGQFIVRTCARGEGVQGIFNVATLGIFSRQFRRLYDDPVVCYDPSPSISSPTDLDAKNAFVMHSLIRGLYFRSSIAFSDG